MKTCEQCENMEISPSGHFRMAYGTDDGLWHSICPHDRDYMGAITWDYFVKFGEVISREKYLKRGN